MHLKEFFLQVAIRVVSLSLGLALGLPFGLVLFRLIDDGFFTLGWSL